MVNWASEIVRTAIKVFSVGRLHEHFILSKGLAHKIDMHCLIMKSLHHLGRRTLCSLSHVDMKTGIPKMVDVSHKAISARTAHARVSN